MRQLGDVPVILPDMLASGTPVDPTDLPPTRVEPPLPESLQWASANDCPWRKRARKGRVTVAAVEDGVVDLDGLLSDAEGGNAKEGDVGSDPRAVSEAVQRNRREVERVQVRASRKRNADKIMQDNTALVLDAVGMTAPIVLIIGITVVQSLISP